MIFIPGKGFVLKLCGHSTSLANWSSIAINETPSSSLSKKAVVKMNIQPIDQTVQKYKNLVS